MTKQELKEAVNIAYDEYLDGVDALAREFTIVPGSSRQIQDDPRTSDQAKVLWEEFQEKEQELNNDYFKSHGEL